MRAVDIITKKRDGKELTREEIRFFIEGFTKGDIPDYQAAAWAMAVLLRGMSSEETVELTQAIIASGDQLDLSGIVPNVVDKHSTGGVGDKTSLVVLPSVMACGLAVGKMSGRGLGFTGGTLDKMESIPGFRSDLTTEEFLTQLKEIGLVLSGQTIDIVPADGKLYALRDVTGTVPSVPLIASSVMSKKIAAGAQAIVLDVKVGNGAFMQSVEQATELAESMVGIARHAGRRAVALISDMNQPLGNAVGNALEVKEAIDTLRGDGPDDFREHSLEVAGHMLVLGKIEANQKQARAAITKVLQNGAAFERFLALVRAQGGDVTFVEDPSRLPKSRFVETVPSERSGYISSIEAREVGLAAMMLGAGRAKKGAPIDHAVGVVVHQKVGDHIEEGEPLFTVHANDEGRLNEAIERLNMVHHYQDQAVDPLPRFYRTVGG
ncbi:MAG: thymidine phosphorylase [Anaerolineales bacterium]|nr:thymidine phosphorylase [Anaerolineales bacterium]